MLKAIVYHPSYLYCAFRYKLAEFLVAVPAALVGGDKVQLVGFGAFEVKERNARVGRNPKTKEEIQIPASRVPVFKAGKALKDVVAK